MLLRKLLIIGLMFVTLVIPMIQLAIGFYYINSIELCPLQHDVMLIMSIGGVFEAIFFVAAFGLLYSITPARFKTDKKLTAAQLSAKGGNRGSQLLIGGITCLFGACAVTFLVLLNTRVYGNLRRAQWTYPKERNYCLFTIYASAFGLMIANYAAFLLLFLVAGILLFGIGM